MKKTRISRAYMLDTVATGIDTKWVNDLPAIRQAINDTADHWRREGYTVPDFAQDALVNDIRTLMRRELNRD